MIQMGSNYGTFGKGVLLFTSNTLFKLNVCCLLAFMLLKMPLNGIDAKTWKYTFSIHRFKTLHAIPRYRLSLNVT